MTTLVKSSPFVELDGVDSWLNTMLSGIGFGPLVRPFLPAADVFITENQFVIELEVPGFVETELGIEVTGRKLTITGKHEETNAPEKAFRLHERLAGEFERTFVLPPEADLEKVTSTFADGVLKVFAPLPVAQLPRTVPITSA